MYFSRFSDSISQKSVSKAEFSPFWLEFGTIQLNLELNLMYNDFTLLF